MLGIKWVPQANQITEFFAVPGAEPTAEPEALP
jgi:hypothetical protein